MGSSFTRIITSGLLLLLINGRTANQYIYSSPPDHPEPPVPLYLPIETDFSDYIWPIDHERIVTSTFAEFRQTHFHGGIDVSTKNSTGFAIFASRSGYVARIRVSPVGYGKMLYLRHADGYYTTYAHLERFHGRIQEFTEREQLRLQRFAVDVELDSTILPVRKGDVIAYSGDTGSGSPHLHFEIRDPKFNFVNPFLSENLHPRDDLPPVIKRISVNPVGENSNVSEGWETKLFGARSSGGARYTIREIVPVTGDIGFGIEARDRINGSRYLNGVYRHQLFVDDSLIFEIKLDRAPSIDAHQIALHYDWNFVESGQGKFERLYSNFENRLPFHSPNRTPSGVLRSSELAEGIHSFRIVSSDFFGNSAEVEGRIQVTHPTLNLLDFSNEDSHPDVDGFKYVLQRPKISIARPRLELIHKDQFVRVLLSTTNEQKILPSIELEEGNSRRKLSIDAINQKQFCATFRPSEEFAGERRVRAYFSINGKKEVAETSTDIYPIRAGTSSRIVLDEGRLEILSLPSSVLQTLFLRVETERDGSESAIYSLLPTSTVLHEGVTVRIRNGDSSPNAGLYFSRGRNWSFIPTTRTGQFLEGRLTRALGEISIKHDHTPPHVSRLRVATGSDQKPNVQFRYGDNLSGVEYDQFMMYIDAVPVIPEIDGEHKRVTYKAAKPLERGSHRLKIRLRDKIGNAAEIEKVFSVR